MLFHAVALVEAKGAHVLWDLDIHPSEGGTLSLGEGRTQRRIRRLLFSVPQVVTYSEMLKGSDDFRSEDVRLVRQLGALERVAIADLGVSAGDLFWLLSHSRIKRLALFDVDLTTEDISKLSSASDCRVEAHSLRPGDEPRWTLLGGIPSPVMRGLPPSATLKLPTQPLRSQSARPCSANHPIHGRSRAARW